MKEHESVLKMLEIMESVSRMLNKGDHVPAGDLEAMLNFLRVFVDKCHHGKEENILFPRLVEVGIPNEGGPVGMMLHEHVIGRGYIAGFAAGIEKYKAGNKEAATEITENIRNYAGLLSPHIFKENNILYQMADMHLTPQDQTELVARFEKLEEEVVGPEKHEQFQQLLKRLTQLYCRTT
ncbi:MAG: hemerythrin domain-containing protein [Bacteroidales bacterium]|nr:hemerythrin domain-containing protein [Bacteroidales bacterium]